MTPESHYCHRGIRSRFLGYKGEDQVLRPLCSVHRDLLIINYYLYHHCDLVGRLAVADHPPLNELRAAIMPNTPTHIYKPRKDRNGISQ
jgi:hypothetical protein